MFCSNCNKTAVCLVKIGGMFLPFCEACAKEDKNDRDTWPISALDRPGVNEMGANGICEWCGCRLDALGLYSGFCCAVHEELAIDYLKARREGKATRPAALEEIFHLATGLSAPRMLGQGLSDIEFRQLRRIAALSASICPPPSPPDSALTLAQGVPGARTLVIPEWVTEAAENPDFDNHDDVRVHDWRSHVPGEIEEFWDVFSIETRYIVIMVAQAEADKEEWD